MQVEYRKAELSDAQVLIEIYNAAFYSDYVKYGECPAYGLTKEMMEKSIENYPKFLILLDNEPVGCVSSRKVEQGTYEVGCLCVVPEHQGKGLGTQAMRFMTSHITDWDKFTLVTPVDKEQNVRFYTEKCGFDIVSTEMDGSVKVARFLLKRDKLKLVRPAKEHKQQALDFRQEFFDNGEKIINGSEMLDHTDDYDSWLAGVTANTSAETVDPNWVVTDTFFAADAAGKIVGIIDLRHTLNDFLKDFGNSGYSVRPTERRKGYATRMLAMLLDIAKQSGMTELHLSVEKTNEPSIKTIVKNGGVYERSFEFEGELADIYKIAL